MRTCVIGGGISGITTAYYLHKAGNDVTLYDAHRYPAMETSYANGGQLSASNAEVWNTWRNVAKAIKWLGRNDAPLSFSLKPEWDKIKWSLSFLSHIGAYETHTIITCRMAIRSLELLDEIADDLGINFHRVNQGIMHIYRDEDEFKHAIEANKLYQEAGLERRLLNREEVYQIEPAIDKHGIVGGFHTPTDFSGDINAFCREVCDALKAKGNFITLTRTINDLNDLTKQYDRIIVCAGVNSPKLAKSINDSLLIYPVKGYSVTITDPGNAPWVSLLDDSAKIVCSRFDNRLRIAGTAEFNGHNKDIRMDRIRPLLNWAEKNFTDIDTSRYNPWAGLRPMTPSMLPIVEQSTNNPKVFYNTGHGHLGWTLSAYTAHEVVSAL